MIRIVLYMPIKQTFLFVIVFAFSIAVNSTSAQALESGANLSKHTIGYVIGYTYPKLADGSKHSMIKSGFNFGLSGALEWGKYYNSGISFMITPMFYYSDLNNTVKRQDLYYWNSDKLIYRQEWTIQYTSLAFCLPISYEFPIFKRFRFGGGANISVPLTTTGSTKRVEYDYYISNHGQGGIYIDPPWTKEYTFDNEYYFEPSVGVSAKILYQIRSNENVESYVSFDYWYDISLSEPVSTHNTRFTLSYTHRSIKLKDTREKWDRYWIRKNKSKG